MNISEGCKGSLQLSGTSQSNRGDKKKKSTNNYTIIYIVHMAHVNICDTGLAQTVNSDWP